MSRSAEARALPLILLIHQTAVRPDAWGEWVEALSADLGDPAIMLTLQLERPPSATVSYRVHSKPEYAQVFADFASRNEVPWPLGEIFEHERFVFSSEFLSDEELAATDFFRSYMAPQGLLTEGQLGHVFGCADGRPLAAVGIYRREGGRELRSDDVSMLDLLVPHLRQAYATHCAMRDSRSRRDAMSEVMNRFQMGVFFLDRRLEVIHASRPALRIVEERDGIELRAGALHVSDAANAMVFADALGQALRGQSASGGGPKWTCPIPRPSGRRPYEALVTSLIGAPEPQRPRQAAVVVFLADPDGQQLGMLDLLRTLHDLTRAEAALAALLCAGESIESAAATRDISVNTARSHLKRIFSKTGVKRQADLVRLLLSSVTALEEVSPEVKGRPPVARASVLAEPDDS